MEKSLEERILDFMKNQGADGVAIREIAEKMGVWQDKAASEINTLIKKGMMRKKGKLFFLNMEEERRPDGPLQEKAFESIIGCNGSLSVQIQIAKAAVCYPPDGIHMLILGGTGVGKTMLANEIRRFAGEEKKREIPFVSLNCAEYADNPQLLLSQLFGHEKGAFTGAVSEKEGLVDQADGGILFLDEIHRLTAVGQEILFTIIDHGEFRRLGGVKTKKVKLLLIGATTENPDSALLATFKRRIPVILQLPLLRERPIGERFDLVSLFFLQEASRINLSIRVSKSMMEYLVMFEGNSNIGDLKNEVMLNCAYSYLNLKSIQNTGKGRELLIDGRTGSRQAHSSCVKPEFHQLLDMVLPDEGLLFETNSEKLPLFDDLGKQWNLTAYDYNKDLGKYTLEEAKNYLFNRISPDVYDAANELVSLAAKQFHEFYSKNITNSLAFFLQQIKSYALVGRGFMEQNRYFEQYETERKFVVSHLDRIQSVLDTKLTEGEIMSIAFLLGQRAVERGTGIGMVIAAYGDKVATQVVNFMKRLVPDALIIALDYPLGNDFNLFQKQLVTVLKSADTGSGVILCTDIAALISRGQEILPAETVNCRMVPSINSALLLELGKGICLTDMTIDKLADSVSGHYCNYVNRLFRKDSFLTGRQENPVSEQRSVIITYCVTGTGSARIARELLMKNSEISALANIIPLGIMSDLTAVKERFGSRLRLIIGFLNPHISGVPFIGLDSAFSQEGLQRIMMYLKSWGNETGAAREADAPCLENRLEIIDRNIRNFTPSLDPEGVVRQARIILSQILACYKEAVEPDFAVRVYIHVIAMFERLSAMETQDVPEENMQALRAHDRFFQWLSNILNRSCSQLGLQWDKSEAYYLMLVLPDPDTGLPFLTA